MIRLALILGALCVALSAIWGTAPLGRVLMSFGLPSLAAPMMTDPEWTGIAAARAGRYDTAVQEFETAQSWLNLGNAQAAQGNYAAALEAYDLGRAAGDPLASANFDLMAAFYAGLGIEADTIIDMTEADKGDTVVESFIAQGSARGAGQGDEVTNRSNAFDLPNINSGGLREGVRKVFDEAHVVANDRWLATLEDQPGAYLAARLRAEQRRREEEAE